MPYISLLELRSSREPSWSSFSYPRHYKPQEKLCRCVSDVSPKSPPLTQLYRHIEKPVDLPPALQPPSAAVGSRILWEMTVPGVPSSGPEPGLDNDYLCDLGQAIYNTYKLPESWFPHL